MEETNQLFALAQSSFKFRMYLLYKLPAAFFSGVRIKEITKEKCTTSVPYKWLTQNPFRSTYFASLAMAAEMSTGILSLSNIYKRKPAISMLVTKMEAHYFKKAIGITYFTCHEGLQIAETISTAANSTEGKSIMVKSTGRNKDGDLIAEFLFTWSFKSKAQS
ncbi:MAG: DUF4442 domain-containing protein [Ginsengibacter sp.]